LENEHADGKSILFGTWNSTLFCWRNATGSNHHESANLAALNLNPSAALNRQNGKTKPKGGNKPGFHKIARMARVAVMADPLFASVVTNLGIKSLNVLKGRRGIQPMLVQPKEDLW
jgi:hypothetical protein